MVLLCEPGQVIDVRLAYEILLRAKPNCCCGSIAQMSTTQVDASKDTREWELWQRLIQSLQHVLLEMEQTWKQGAVGKEERASFDRSHASAAK